MSSSGTSSDSLRCYIEGWLKHKEKRKYLQHWFVLKGKLNSSAQLEKAYLFCFKTNDTKDKSQFVGSTEITFPGGSVVLLKSSKTKFTFKILFNNTKFNFKAKDDQTRQRWIYAFCNLVGKQFLPLEIPTEISSIYCEPVENSSPFKISLFSKAPKPASPPRISSPPRIPLRYKAKKPAFLEDDYDPFQDDLKVDDEPLPKYVFDFSPMRMPQLNCLVDKAVKRALPSRRRALLSEVKKPDFFEDDYDLFQEFHDLKVDNEPPTKYDFDHPTSSGFHINCLVDKAVKPASKKGPKSDTPDNEAASKKKPKAVEPDTDQKLLQGRK